jgi:hypothetical protein
MGISIRYGVICGLLTCFWMMSEFLLGLHNEHYDYGQYTEYFALFIPLVTIFLALREKRRSSPSHASFANLLGTGIFMAAISGLIIAAFFVVYIQYINPDWQNIIVAHKAQKLFSEGASFEQLANAAENYKTMSLSHNQFTFVFGGSFIIGSLVSLIYSTILRRKLV